MAGSRVCYRLAGHILEEGAGGLIKELSSVNKMVLISDLLKILMPVSKSNVLGPKANYSIIKQIKIE